MSMRIPSSRALAVCLTLLLLCAAAFAQKKSAKPAEKPVPQRASATEQKAAPEKSETEKSATEKSEPHGQASFEGEARGEGETKAESKAAEGEKAESSEEAAFKE